MTGAPLKRASSKPPVGSIRPAGKKKAAGRAFDALADGGKFILRMLLFFLIGLFMAARMVINGALHALERFYFCTLADIEE
jgi:hypothetical protein